MEYYDKISLAADTLITRLAGRAPTVGIILGSGWGSIVERAKNAVEIPYSDIPGMAVSTVPGHAGIWICGNIGGKTVLIMSGRLHAYEGHELRDIVMPVYMMRKAGVGTLIVTNAAGAVNESYKAGDMMIISDHINFASLNPLRGANDDRLGTRFPDMSAAYDGELTALAASVAAECGVCAHRGVYLLTGGPSFETPAEIRAFRLLGADAVGMSTVPEVIAARHAGLRVLGLSCMTNMAAGVLPQPLSHAEVLETAERVRGSYRDFTERLITRI